MTVPTTRAREERASAPRAPEPRARTARRAPAPRAARGPWRRVRAALFWAHLATGVAAGAVVLIMSLTGVLLAYQRQLTEWSAGAGTVAPPAPGAARLPLDSLVARARAASPGGTVTSVTVRAEGAVVAVVGTRHNVYVDPYTGAVLEPSATLRELFVDAERWHRSLATGAGLRDAAGARVTGASNLAFLFLLLSGLVLWVPRRWTWPAVRAVLLFQRRATARQRDWNWHHVLGVWSAPALFVVVLSGVFISYQWPTRLVQRAAGIPADPPRGEGGGRAAGGRGGPGDAGAADAPPVALAPLVAAAAREVPGWQSVQLRVPQPGDRRVTLTVAATATSMRPDRRTQLTLDAATARVVSRQDYADQDAARRVRSWMRWLHTGEAFGVVGQTVAMLVSAAGVVLVWTGLALALRRLRARLARRRAVAA